MAHHHHKKMAEQQAEDEPVDEDQGQDQDQDQDQDQHVPPPADPADQLEHLAKLHDSGALTDEEFTAAKAQALGS